MDYNSLGGRQSGGHRRRRPREETYQVPQAQEHIFVPGYGYLPLNLDRAYYTTHLRTEPVRRYSPVHVTFEEDMLHGDFRRPVSPMAFPMAEDSNQMAVGPVACPSSDATVESTMRALHHHLGEAETFFNGVNTSWEGEAKDAQKWMSRDTRVQAWKDLVTSKLKDPKQREEIPNNIRRCIRDGELAVNKNWFETRSKDQHRQDRRKRMVLKASVTCAAIVQLAHDGMVDPAACTALLKEIDEVKKDVNPDKDSSTDNAKELFGPYGKEGEGEGEGEGDS